MSFKYECPKCYIKWKSAFYCVGSDACNKCLFDTLCNKCNEPILKNCMRIRKDEKIFHLYEECVPNNLSAIELKALSNVILATTKQIIKNVSDTIIYFIVTNDTNLFSKSITDFILKKSDELSELTKIINKYNIELYKINTDKINYNMNVVSKNIKIIEQLLMILDNVVQTIVNDNPINISL